MQKCLINKMWLEKSDFWIIIGKMIDIKPCLVIKIEINVAWNEYSIQVDAVATLQWNDVKAKKTTQLKAKVLAISGKYIIFCL